MKTGEVEDDQTMLGFAINSKSLEKIAGLVADAKSKGANAVFRGQRSSDSPSNFLPSHNPDEYETGNGSQSDGNVWACRYRLSL